MCNKPGGGCQDDDDDDIPNRNDPDSENCDRPGGSCYDTSDRYVIFLNVGGETHVVWVRRGKPVAQPDDPTIRKGYIFKGWYKEATGINKWDFDTRVTEHITLYAKWLALYTVTFEKNGGDGDIPEQEVAHGDTVRRPTNPTKLKQKFVAWYKEDTLATRWDFLSDKVTNNLTLYARWIDDTINTHIITFDCKNGSAVDEQVVVENLDRVQRPTDPIRKGYKFVEWWYKSSSGDIPYDFDALVYRDMTLYAVWTINTYKVTFMSNGETVDTLRVSHGGTVSRPDDPPGAKDGYLFDKWCSDAALATAWNFTKGKVVQDTILYAHWENSVVFVTYGGTPVPAQKVKPGDMLPRIDDPVRENYIFKGWYRDSIFFSLFDLTKSRVDSGGMTLYAGWEFDDNVPWMESITVRHDNERNDTTLTQPFHYTLECGNTAKTLHIALDLPSGLTSNFSGDTLTLSNLRAAFGIDTTVIISTSHTITRKETSCNIKVERKFMFDSIVHAQLGDRLLMVVNTVDNNGGYLFQRAWWWVNSEHWSTRSGYAGSQRFYYASPTGMTITDTVHVRLLDGITGQEFEVCPYIPRTGSVPPNALTSVYPNPVAAGGVVHFIVKSGDVATLPDGYLAEHYDSYRLLNVQGRLQRSGNASELQNGLTMPTLPGSYLLILEGKTGKTAVLIVVGN
ncbi:MAG: InlB B-repeat-containing protein [Prevotellaceae bacterium]|jgi:uncharacterized repeat protein (TIGR02543 family)|nr:InlB B-repeat-containing protein [Prevotellaceae bacterium]